MPKTLLLDVDEVLANFQDPVLAIGNKLTGKNITPETYTEWDLFSQFTSEEKDLICKEIEKPGFCQSLPVRPGAQEAIDEIRSFMHVFPVTSPFHSESWVYERVQWLHKHFGFHRSQVINTSAKYMIHGDAILDDNPSHVTSWLDPSHLEVNIAPRTKGLGMMWHIPNTRTLPYDHLRVRTWEEVIQKLRKLCEE